MTRTLNAIAAALIERIPKHMREDVWWLEEFFYRPCLDSTIGEHRLACLGLEPILQKAVVALINARNSELDRVRAQMAIPSSIDPIEEIRDELKEIGGPRAEAFLVLFDATSDLHTKRNVIRPAGQILRGFEGMKWINALIQIEDTRSRSKLAHKELEQALEELYVHDHQGD